MEPPLLLILLLSGMGMAMKGRLERKGRGQTLVGTSLWTQTGRDGELTYSYFFLPLALAINHKQSPGTTPPGKGIPIICRSRHLTYVLHSTM